MSDFTSNLCLGKRPGKYWQFQDKTKLMRDKNQIVSNLWEETLHRFFRGKNESKKMDPVPVKNVPILCKVVFKLSYKVKHWKFRQKLQCKNPKKQNLTCWNRWTTIFYHKIDLRLGIAIMNTINAHLYLNCKPFTLK